MSEWTNCKGKFALVPLPNGFLVALPARQCSQVNRSTLSLLGSGPYLTSLSIRFLPIWPSRACHKFTSSSEICEDVIIE